MEAPIPAPLESLEATLERVVYSHPDSGWSVLRVLDPLGTELAAVGTVIDPRPGDQLRLEGRWAEDPKFGRQFVFERQTLILPTSGEALVRYLASGAVPGLGESIARRLVDHFGEQTVAIIEKEPEKLRQVSGIGAKRAGGIQQAWQEQQGVRELSLLFHEHGLPPHLAVKTFRRFGSDAVSVVRSDPYRLAREVRGIGFRSADRIARHLGLPIDAPTRIEAGLLAALSDASGQGHVCLPTSELEQAAIQLLGVDASLLRPALDRLTLQLAVVRESAPEMNQDAVYLQRYHDAETELAAALTALAAAAAPPLESDPDAAIHGFETSVGFDLAPEQRRAIWMALISKVVVITGGPGTGKTTLVRGIVDIFAAHGRRVALAAPTGRAAKRLAEATGREALTLHRLLGFDPRHGGFVHGPDHPIEADVLVIDEVSMLDTMLAASITGALNAASRLVLVGDADQLPSVGAGNVLADLLAAGTLPTVRLEQVFRQAAASRIVANAHRVRRGEMPEDGIGGEDFFFFERETPEQTRSTLIHLVTERIPAGFGFDPMTQIQVLSPMNRGPLGVHALNDELRQALNPKPAQVKRGGLALALGDRIMQTRNNYDLEIFNGDLGRVEMIDEDQEIVLSRFDGRLVTHPFADLDQLTLAYACSVHKSQGSEYPCVVVPVHRQHAIMLQRNLLYTALTRARQLVILVGQRSALALAVRNARTRKRNTRLGPRLQG